MSQPLDISVTPVFTGKLQGQTAAGVGIAAITINLYADGTIQFLDPPSGLNTQYKGVDCQFNALLRAVLNGPGGVPDPTVFFGYY